MKNSPQKIYGPITIIYCPNFLGLFNICKGFQFPKKLLYNLFSSEKTALTLFNFFHYYFNVHFSIFERFPIRSLKFESFGFLITSKKEGELF